MNDNVENPAESEDSEDSLESSGIQSTEATNLIDLISSAYLQRSINSSVEITLQDQVNARNQRMLLVSKQLNNLVNMK